MCSARTYCFLTAIRDRINPPADIPYSNLVSPSVITCSASTFDLILIIHFLFITVRPAVWEGLKDIASYPIWMIARSALRVTAGSRIGKEEEEEEEEVVVRMNADV